MVVVVLTGLEPTERAVSSFLNTKHSKACWTFGTETKPETHTASSNQQIFTLTANIYLSSQHRVTVLISATTKYYDLTYYSKAPGGSRENSW